ncbi:MAG TPA: hypothetical protein ENK22_06675 [Persephonella sp.]|nr:hypothetical protein [Persephonella sp.]
MFEQQANNIENMLNQFKKNLRYNLNQAYYHIPLQQVILILEEDLAILKELKPEDLNYLSWYSTNSFNNNIAYLKQDVGLINTIISGLLNDISTNLSHMINQPVNNSYAVAFTQSVLRLHTIIKDFRFDLDVKRLAGIRAKLNDAESFLDKAREVFNEIDSKRHELEDALFQLETFKNQLLSLQELYEQISDLSEELSRLRNTKENIDHEYQDFLTKKDEIDEVYSKTQQILQTVENLKEDFNKKIGEYEAFINQYKEEKLKVLQDFDSEIQKRYKELDKYREKQQETLEDLIKRAKETFEWTRASGMREVFVERIRGLRWEVWFYFGAFLMSAILTLFVSFSAIFYPKAFFQLINAIPVINLDITIQSTINNNGWLLLFVRAGIIIPLIFFTYLLWSSFSKTRMLMEEYRNKEILAQNLIFGSSMLSKDLGLKSDRVENEFVKPTVEKLLEDPIEKVFGKGKGTKSEDTILKKPLEEFNEIKTSIKGVLGGKSDEQS